MCKSVSSNGAALRALSRVIAGLTADIVGVSGHSFHGLPRSTSSLLIVNVVLLVLLLVQTTRMMAWSELDQLRVCSVLPTDYIVHVNLGTIDELLTFDSRHYESTLNHMIHLISQLLIHSQMLHPRSFIN